MAQTKRTTARKRSVKAPATPTAERPLSNFEKEMAERVAALIAAGKMPAFEDLLKAVRKVRERELEAPVTQDNESD